MKKIISLFQRNYDGDRLVRDQVTPGAEWALAGEGIATRKFDGTSCLFKDDEWFKRYDAKHGKKPPTNFIPAQDPDTVTGHWPGWVPVTELDRWHNEAIFHGLYYRFELGKFRPFVPFSPGTYELLGPKINSNPENTPHHIMVRHGDSVIQELPLGEKRTFEVIMNFFSLHHMEGVVFYHCDGRMVKIKKRDFGLQWP